jgi:hypothetical protein
VERREILTFLKCFALPFGSVIDRFCQKQISNQQMVPLNCHN